ncbi:MAG: phosphoglucosamine mutase [Hydrocarboniphaga sp.]|uniref:phosphoglucosamine mutase n=1 Tax=Hydrocarboniphaga sp. TaxID=2033016 RepID=UPI00262D4D8B|nr:phosphoglucosamine mutase [Hydrocarboniphaga sp.]MDB5970745.1 phosphoglucosamine mutase [Hydrocarboniphaga sp.]
MSRQYFGTDGIRGLVGKAPMTPEFALKLGWAAGRVLARDPGAHVLIGKDTRRSGYMFESALEAGLSAAGVRVSLLGPLPTPAVAFLTRDVGAQAGVVISASHNPHHDNGVKFFSAEGDKLSDAIEHEIEGWLERDLECVAPEQLGLVRRLVDAQQRYVSYCCSTYVGEPLSGLRVVVDCANGAAYQVGPDVLRRLGAEVETIGDAPDGFNINRDCGSTHLAGLRAEVLRRKAMLGIAFDGDADRCLMVDENGETIDGDQILFVIARQRLGENALQGPVVGTLMSNLGLEQAILKLGVGFTRAKVGDRYVLELMRSSGSTLGGETSGHTLCLDRSRTGDGIVTALQVLAAMKAAALPLSAMVAGLRKCPQVLINVPVSGKAAPVLALPEVQQAVTQSEARLGADGRVLLRASGTEPLIRVMVEATRAEDAQAEADAIAGRVRAACRA